jgi:hypothetical protein
LHRYRLSGGGGTAQSYVMSLFGKANRDVISSETIWESMSPVVHSLHTEERNHEQRG